MASSSGMAPMYAVAHDRPLLPLEHFAVQGVPVPSLCDSGTERQSNPWHRVLQDGSMTPADMRHLTGNGMHIAAVGSVLGFILMTVRRAGVDEFQ